MKRIRLQLALMAVLLCTAKVSAHDFEVDGVYYNSTKGATISTIDAWKSWLGYQDNGAVFGYGLSDTIVLGETTYFKRSGDSIYYRQDVQKVYRYNVNTATETLAFDFGLNVGDNFKLYEDCEMVVESVSDTNVVNIIFSEEKYDNQRVLRLRGAEDTSITDIWVEGIGSLHYGIERPTHAEDIKSQALAYCEVFDSYNAKFLVDIGNVRGAGVDLGQEIDPEMIEGIYVPTFNTDFLKFRLVNNTLHVGGYISCNCGMEIYLAAKDMGNSIELEMCELAPYADCYSLYAIDISFPNFTGEKYDVMFMGKKIATVEKERLTEITCREEGQLPGLLTDAIKREAQILAISGLVNGDDLKAINECKSLIELDLTNADLKVIPEYTWCHKLIEKIHLPLVIDTLNFNAIWMDGSIEVVVPGKFPYLQNYPSNNNEDDEYTHYTDECWDYLQFVVPDDNLLLYSDTFGIYSADRKILYKCQHRALNDFESVLIDVEHVGPYAFMSTMAFESCNLLFSERLNFVDCTALEGIYINLLTGHWWEPKDIGAHISFLGIVPPRKNGLLRNHGNLEIAVSDVRDYLVAHSSWAVENICSFNKDNNAQDSYIGDYTMLAACDVEEGDNGFNNATFTIQVPTSGKLHLVDPYSDGRYEVDSPIDADTPITLTVTITDDKDTVLCSEKVHAFPCDTLTLSRVLTDIPAGTICTVTTQLTAYDAVLWSVKKTQDFAIDKEPKPYLVTEGKQWAVCVTGTLLRPNQTTFTYRLQGDTIINSKRYLIEHESYDIHLNDWIPSGHYMREEDGKVYRKYGRKKEAILLDYNMQVGDTLRYNDRTDGMGNIIDDYYTYVCLVGVRDTILPNGDGVLRRCYDAVIGEYAQGEYHSTNWEATFVEDIGWLDTGLSDEIFFTSGCGKELLYVKQDNTMLYQKEKGVYWIGNHVNWRPLTKRGYGLYHSDSYLYAYTMDEAAGVTDSTDFARWNDRTVIRFDVDTIGYNAFSGATFRQGQIICFTERLNTILKDAFAGINIVPRSSQETAITDDLTLIFEGANPPSIDKSHVMDYADSSYRINCVVPDLTTYIANDIQWTYTSLMTIDDLLGGNISPENEITVTDPTEVKVTDVEEGDSIDNSGPVVEVEARPRKDIPVRIGDGENKDIYSRAPAWQRYTIELKITDSSNAVLYEGSMVCTDSSACVFNAALPYWPNDDIIYLHSRSIDMFGRTSEWTTQAVTLTRIEHAKEPDCDAYYDLMGRKIANPVHGIYIKNGKKVIL